MQLPPPVMEQPAGATAPAEAQPVVPERAPSAGERGAAPAAAAPPLATLPLPPAPPAQVPSSVETVPTRVGTGAATALPSDRDLIDKEVVNKAKQIVERTKDDPHKQSEELTIFKAGYLQQSYGKQIKLSQ